MLSEPLAEAATLTVAARTKGSGPPARRRQPLRSDADTCFCASSGTGTQSERLWQRRTHMQLARRCQYALGHAVDGWPPPVVLMAGSPTFTTVTSCVSGSLLLIFWVGSSER